MVYPPKFIPSKSIGFVFTIAGEYSTERAATFVGGAGLKLRAHRTPNLYLLKIDQIRQLDDEGALDRQAGANVAAVVVHQIQIA